VTVKSGADLRAMLTADTLDRTIAHVRRGIRRRAKKALPVFHASASRDALAFLRLVLSRDRCILPKQSKKLSPLLGTKKALLRS
jgi:hypothetical protein